MSTITTRAGKGSPLTNTEMDNNLTNLNTDKLQSGDTAASLTITSADINGGTIDGTAIGGSTAAAGSFTSLTDSGNLTFTGTGNRILGDFSNATQSNRIYAQTSTTNGNTNFSVIPNGTSVISTLQALNNSDPTNASKLNLFVNSAQTSIRSDINGTGTYLPMTFWTNNAEQMRIDTSGNVGIGTNAPTTKLTINNNTVLPSAGAITGTGLWQVGADSSANYILLDGSSGVPIIIGRRSQGTAASPAAVGNGQNLLALQGAGYGATSYSSASRVGINLIVNEAWSDTAQGTRITFSTTANTTTTTTEKMRIDDAGNVGIGTTAPSTYGGTVNKLAVVGANTILAAGAKSATNAVLYLSSTDVSNPMQLAIVQNTNASYSFQSVESGVAFKDLVFQPSGGNVGIGTASPNVRLDIGSGIGRTTDSWQVSNNGIITQYRANAAGSLISNDAAAPIQFSPNNTERMRIDSAGPLFVTGGSSTLLSSVPGSTGNSTVYARLGLTAVNDGVSLPYFQTYNSNAGTDLKTWRHGGDSSGNYIFQTVNDAYSSATNRIIITTGGNVGIGTDPAGRFEVAAATDKNLNIDTGGIGSSLRLSAINDAANANVDLTIQASNTIFSQAGTERMRIDSTGNVRVVQASRGTITTDNDLSFDMNAASNFSCTPAALGTLTFTNITSGQSGFILLVNTGGFAITAAATTKVSTNTLTTISTAGTYLLSYFSDGTNVFVTNSGALA